MNAHSKQIEAVDPGQFRFEAERDFVGTLLAYPNAISAALVEQIVGLEDFQDHTMARLYWLFLQGSKQGLQQFPLINWIIGELAPDAWNLADIGLTPSGLIAKCMVHAFPAIALEGAARQVKVNHLEVQLEKAVFAGNQTEEAQRLAGEITRLKTAHLEQGGGPEQLGETVGQVLNDVNDAYQQGHAPRDFASCGISDLARMIGGWRRKRLYVIAGRPGMGKTTMALSSLLRTALKGHGVMLFSLEMGKEELSEMALCDLAYDHNRRVEYRDISILAVARSGFREKFEHVLAVSSLFNSLPFYIDDRQGLTVAAVRSRAQQYAQRLEADGRRLEVIAIDHLGLLRASQSFGGNKVAQTEDVSNDLKRLAKDMNCAVVALAQLSRAVEGREDKRPTLADLRWSGAIEQDADVVMMPYRPEYYLQRKEDDPDKEMKREEKLARVKNRLELLIEKHRGGPTGMVELYCDMGCAVVRNLGEAHG